MSILSGTKYFFTAFSLLTLACGGSNLEPQVAPPPEPFDPHVFLFENGLKQIEAMEAPQEGLEDILAKIKTTKGAERRLVHFKASLKYLHEAEVGEDVDAQKSFRKAVQQAARGARRIEDDLLKQNLSFLQLWCNWRLKRPAARNLARRFLKNHDDPELEKLTWAIRGEIEMQNERWNEAIDAFGHLIGESNDPLYAYSLLRIGISYKSSGRQRNADRSFRHVRDFACHDDAPTTVRYISQLSAAELGTPVHLSPGGRPLPSTCITTAEEK